MSTQAAATDLRYPIGPFKLEAPYSDTQREEFVRTISEMPDKLRAAVAGLNDARLETPYRDGGWTVRQTVHHIADSHLNSYIRFRLAATEENPTIKTYNEKAWAELVDAKREPVEVSLQLIDALHRRWVVLMKSFTAEDWKRTMNHPERGPIDLSTSAAIYAWHSRHHVAHITELRKRMGW